VRATDASNPPISIISKAGSKLGRRLPGRRTSAAWASAMRKRNRRPIAHMLHQHHARAFDRGELALPVGPLPHRSAQGPAQGEIGIALRHELAEQAVHLAEILLGERDGRPGDPPATAIAAARVALSSPGVAASTARASWSRSSGWNRMTRQRERIVGSSRPSPCTTSRKNVPCGGSSRLSAGH
jgi:hypothetical protein